MSPLGLFMYSWSVPQPLLHPSMVCYPCAGLTLLCVDHEILESVLPVAFHITPHIHFRRSLAYFTPTLHDQTAFLNSMCVSCPCCDLFFALEFAWELLAPLFRLCSTSCLFSWTILQLGGGNSIAATSSFATQPCWAFSRRVRAFPLMACRYFHLLTHLVQVLLVGLAFLMFNLDVQKCSL